MTKLTFVKGIEYLNAYYTNFKVDLGNELVQRIWYDALKHIDDKSFEFLVKDYSKKNIYAPQSPTHLLDYFDNLLELYSKDLKDKIIKLENKYNERVYSLEHLEDIIVLNYDKAIEEARTNGDTILINLLVDMKKGVIKRQNINKDTITPYITKNEQLSIGVK